MEVAMESSLASLRKIAQIVRHIRNSSHTPVRGKRLIRAVAEEMEDAAIPIDVQPLVRRIVVRKTLGMSIKELLGCVPKNLLAV